MTRRGFTLLEVMVALVILALGLSALFSSQVGAVKMTQRARATIIATLLARCKMGELEEELTRDGFPTAELTGSDECCEDAEHEGFECEWKVTRVVLPDQAGDAEDPMAMLTGGGEQPPVAGAGAEGPAPAAAADPALGEGGGAMDSVSDMLAGGAAGDGLGSLIMSYAYPIMKPVIEEQVRRVDVTVSWSEGKRQTSFDVSQFLVSPLAAGAPPVDEEAADQAAADDAQGAATAGQATTSTSSGAAPRIGETEP